MRPIEMLDPTHNGKKTEGICTTCGEMAKKFRDSLSLKEWSISGMCQSCQDSVFGKGDDENIEG